MSRNIPAIVAAVFQLHELRERRISLGEIAAQFEQIRRTVSQCRNEIDELTRRREEIMRHELPKAEEELRVRIRFLIESSM